ncbi:DNA primase [Parasphingopyxis algicola]|uniref:DNA primase n=1 Tax=Parasphingopyxis algicola TaxID=2026624 RepID=UPI0015A21E2B|nr:DNA primase [Parasphingopyxis algicola]QLC24226.1 DNA primase [Parasphingopyxis algicola]
MSLSPAFLDELRMRTTLSSVIGKHTKLQKAGREWKACCPFHKEKTPSFTVNDEKGFYHCFGCGAHGDAIRFLTETRGLPFIDAVKELAEGAGMQVPAPDPRMRERQEKSASLRDVMEAAADWYVDQLHSPAGAETRAYLEQRGITAKTQRAFGLGFAPDARGKLEEALKEFGRDKLIEAGLIAVPEDSGRSPYDRFRSRLMFPIRDPRGRVIAFSGRIIGDGKPKYLNSPDTPLFDKGRTIYNFDRASPAARDAKRIIVVEGQMDVIALDQAGFGEAVAPLGTALTEHQLAMLWRIDEAPILCFDGDAAGQKAAARAIDRALPAIQPERSLAFVQLPPGQDPDDIIRSGGTDALRAQFEEPLSLDAFLWRHEAAKIDPKSPTARAKLKRRLNELAGAIGDPAMREEFGRDFRERFWDAFGWKKKEVDFVRDALAATSGRNRLRGLDLYIRAILLGLSRYPGVIQSRADQIQSLHIGEGLLARWRDLLVAAAFERPDLDEDMIETILASAELESAEKRHFWRDLGFSFFYPKTDPEIAVRDLEAAIDTIARSQELDENLEDVRANLERASESEDFEGVWNRESERRKRLMEEKQRLHDELETLGEAAA